ncbi:hypothetical protein D3C71_1282990 [compost metagenome]
MESAGTDGQQQPGLAQRRPGRARLPVQELRRRYPQHHQGGQREHLRFAGDPAGRRHHGRDGCGTPHRRSQLHAGHDGAERPDRRHQRQADPGRLQAGRGLPGSAGAAAGRPAVRARTVAGRGRPLLGLQQLRRHHQRQVRPEVEADRHVAGPRHLRHRLPCADRGRSVRRHRHHP